MGNSKTNLRDRSKLGRIPAFWKKNESLLHALEQSQMPSKSRLIFKEMSSKTVNGNTITNYDLINIYDNRKNFFAISAKLAADGSIIREEILAAENNLSNVKKTVLDGSKITNKAQVEWIKNMGKSNTCQLFRA